jgi:hypothetical protein
MKFNFKKLLGVVAPTLATAMGSPVAGMAVKFALSKLGIDEAEGEDGLSKFLQSADPEALAKIKEVDAKLDVELKRLDIDLEKIHAADRNSARNREIKTGDHWTLRILSIIAIVMFGVALYMLTNSEVNESVKNIVYLMIGGLIGNVNQVYGYYFGSSAGSKAKTASMVKK